LAEHALLKEAATIRHSAGTTSSNFHGGQIDRAMGELVTVCFVVAVLLFVSVLGFIFVESSSKKRPPSGHPVGDYRSMADGSGALSPRAAAALVRDANIEAEPSALYLCGPELVVPTENECNLVIPSIQYQYSHVERSELFINDTEGSSILRGVIFKKAQPDGTRIMLQSRDGNITWGRCIDTGRRNRFKLCGRSDDPEIQNWGTIEMKQGGALSLVTSNGHKVKFEQSTGPAGRRKTLRLVDGYGVLLCLSEMSVGGRAVRVGPLVDIGFVMLSHLAMDVFQLEEFGELR